MRRRVLPFVAVAAVAASVLTGCSAASQADNCVPTLSPGALSDSVKVSGDSADTLKVSFSKATEAANPQRSIVQQADSTSAERGTLVEEGMIFKANLAYVDAVNGEVLQVAPTFGTDEGVPYLADAQAGPVFDAVLCAAVVMACAACHRICLREVKAAVGAGHHVLRLLEGRRRRGASRFALRYFGPALVAPDADGHHDDQQDEQVLHAMRSSRTSATKREPT